MLRWLQKEGRENRWKVFLGLALAIGLFLRLNDVLYWYRTAASHFFADNQPILLASDGYYYLNLARNWLESSSFFPLPPLAAFLAASLAQIFGLSLDWTATLLPPLLVLFFAHAVFLLGRQMGGKSMAALVVFFALLSPQYALRSRAGWFDTDVLNVAFAVYAAAFAVQFYRKKRNGWLLLCLINLLFFAWWWDTALAAVLFLSLAPVALMLLLQLSGNVFKGRHTGKHLTVIISGGIIIVAGLAFAFCSREKLIFIWQYITKTQSTDLFNVGDFIAELRSAGTLHALQVSAGGIGSFILAGIGLISLVRQRRLEMCALLPLFLISLLSFTANRFLIFAAPLVGLGLGALLMLLQQRVQERSSSQRALAVCTVLGLLTAVTMILPLEAANRQRPIRNKATVEAMLKLSDALPAATTLWSSFGNGYAFEYFARRAVIIDGGRHDDLRMYATYRPLVLSDERLAANWMHFYNARGNAGLRKCRQELGNGDWATAIQRLDRLLTCSRVQAAELIRKWTAATTAAEVDIWLTFLFAPDAPPAAFFLDENFLRTFWFYIGAWDFAQQASVDRLMLSFNPAREFTVDDDRILAGISQVGPFQLNLDGQITQFTDELFIYLQSGRIQSGTYTGVLKNLLLIGTDTAPETKQFAESGLSFVFLQDADRGLLLNDGMYNSVFANLYFRQNSAGGYFEPVIRDGTACQVWLARPHIDAAIE